RTRSPPPSGGRRAATQPRARDAPRKDWRAWRHEPGWRGGVSRSRRERLRRALARPGLVAAAWSRACQRGAVIDASRGAASARPLAVARVTKIIGSSSKGWQEAVDEAMKRANRTLRGVTGLHVLEMKAQVQNGKIKEYRATVEVTFILE